MADMEDALLCVYNEETGIFEEYQEPFAIVEYPTEREFEFMKVAVEHYKKHRWVSVKDRVPELPPIRDHVSRMVLTYRSGDKRVTVMFYERTVVRGKAVERWKTYWDRIGDAPDFWMPLPEPPEEG